MSAGAIARRKIVALGFAAWNLPLAAAEPWPSRPIHLVVAYPPGGIADAVAKLLVNALMRQLNVPVLIQYRAGAGGQVAMQYTSRASPDGHTLCMTAIAPVTLPVLAELENGNGARTLLPVIEMMRTPALILGTRRGDQRGLFDTLEDAKKRGRAVTWASSGYGSTGHMILTQIRIATGVDIVHIPYRGGGQQLIDALSGQFDILSSNLAPAQMQFVHQGRLHALAVGWDRRVTVLPEVPTLAEAGFATANLDSSFGVFAPPRTSDLLVQRIGGELRRALQGGEIRQMLQNSGSVVIAGSSDDFATHIAAERAKLASLSWLAP
jgi:tripartite-type tricarboxylate transporter receptor subunit TctC